MAQSIVIFGASGDLTSRKLVPALYSLFVKNYLPDDAVIVGVSRSPKTDQQWRRELKETTKNFSHRFTDQLWEQFENRIHYLSADVSKMDDFVQLRKDLRQIEGESSCNRIYYLSISPKLYEQTIENLGKAHGIAIEGIEEEPLCGNPRRKVVIEKPFGTDLETAVQLNKTVHRSLDESQVYRIDHYLGKETVQNLLVLRFANTIFEPIWNRNYVDHVQISVAEDVPVGRRGGYYDSAGVMRDMFQNHLLQLLTITAMEAPSQFTSDLVREEKVKVLRSIAQMTPEQVATDTFRGQYLGYLEEPGVPSESQTATFAAIRLHVDNWRWNGVPFYLRSGKAMSCRSTQIVIQFRQPPTMLFGNKCTPPDANRLMIQIQPGEGIQLHFQTKVPDAGMNLRMTDLEFDFQEEFKEMMPDAYQRLLLDALNSDSSLFLRSDEVEQSWSIIDPIIETWDKGHGPELFTYEPGEWGPERSENWLEKFGHRWFNVCPVIHH